MKRLLHDEYGLTLMELLAAVVILSVLIMSIITLTNYHHTSNYRTQTESEAIRAAEYVLNQYRAVISEADDEMAAWQALAKNGVWSDDDKFSYSVNAVPLDEHDQAPAAPIVQEEVVALPGIILLEHEPWLVTVTVTWGDTL